MVDVASLAGVFARTELPSKKVGGYTADYVHEIKDDGSLVLGLGPGEWDHTYVSAGQWIPIYAPEAMSFLKSVPVYPQNGQLTIKSVRRGVKVPTFFCDRVFANSVLRWYARVGDFVSPPGLIMVPSADTPKMTRLEFQSMSVLPALAFEGEGDAILWSLTAFEQGADLFAEPKSSREKEVIEQVNAVLFNPGNYFG